MSKAGCGYTAVEIGPRSYVYRRRQKFKITAPITQLRLKRGQGQVEDPGCSTKSPGTFGCFCGAKVPQIGRPKNDGALRVTILLYSASQVTPKSKEWQNYLIPPREETNRTVGHAFSPMPLGNNCLVQGRNNSGRYSSVDKHQDNGYEIRKNFLIPYGARTIYTK